MVVGVNLILTVTWKLGGMPHSSGLEPYLSKKLCKLPSVSGFTRDLIR